MFVIVQRCYPAPKSGGGKYRRPVRVLVVNAANGIKHAYRRGDPDVVEVWENVDSRYGGPRAAYGRALLAARELVDRLNESTAVTA